MAKVGDTRTQQQSPGAGWSLSGSTRVGGAQVNVWIYRGTSTTTTTPPGGGGGTGNTYAASSGGSSSSALQGDAAARRGYLDAYNNLMDPSGKKRFTPPNGMLAQAVKNQWSEATLETWVRQNDPAYKNTAAYKTLASNFKTMVASIYGPKFNISKDKKLNNAMVDYAKLPPDKAVNDTVVMKYFKQYIMNTATFSKLYPAFKTWFNSQQSITSGSLTFSNPTAVMGDYNRAVNTYTSAFRQQQTGVGSATAVIPPALLIEAMKNNWSIDGIEWTTAVRNTAQYMGSQGAEIRGNEFDANWQKMFQGTNLEGTAPDAGLRSQYVKGTSDFSTFFNDVMYLKGSASQAMIDAAFPSYSEFLIHHPEAQAGELDLFGQGGYFDRKDTLIDIYRQMLESPDALPPADILNRALAGGWSDPVFQLYVRQNDVAYQSSPTAISRQGTLTRYWDALFGQGTPIDPNVENAWMGGSLATPDDLLGDIQKLDIFKIQYPNYETFQKNAVQAGAGPSADPALYKKYQQAFKDAFSNQGLDPDQFTPIINNAFDAGVAPDDFTQYMNQWSQQKQTFKLTTGETPDMSTALGVAQPGTEAGKAAGGNLRKELEQELAKYKQYVQPNQTATRPTEGGTTALKQVI